MPWIQMEASPAPSPQERFLGTYMGVTYDGVVNFNASKYVHTKLLALFS